MLGEILEHSCVYNLKEKLLLFAFSEGRETSNCTAVRHWTANSLRKPERREILKLLKLILLKRFVFQSQIHLTFCV